MMRFQTFLGVIENMAFVLGVDLDGVCADYTAGLKVTAAKILGRDINDLTDDVSWEYTEWGIATREQYLEIHTEAVMKRRMFATLPPIEGAAETLWRLSDAGVWIRIITHRLHVKGGHSTAVSDTCTWLEAHNIPYRDICFLGEKPQVEAHMYVDDSPVNIDALRRDGNKVIVFDQPYNRELGGLRAYGWEEVEKFVTEEMQNNNYPPLSL